MFWGNVCEREEEHLWGSVMVMGSVNVCERENTCSGTATAQLLDNGSLVAFTGTSKQHGELKAGEEKV